MEDFQTALEIVKEMLEGHDNANRLYGQPNQDFYSIKFVADKGIDRRLCRIWYRNLKLDNFDAVQKGVKRSDRLRSYPLRDLCQLFDYSGVIRRAADTYHFP